jgi:hypothetical protein
VEVARSIPNGFRKILRRVLTWATGFYYAGALCFLVGLVPLRPKTTRQDSNCRFDKHCPKSTCLRARHRKSDIQPWSPNWDIFTLAIRWSKMLLSSPWLRPQGEAEQVSLRTSQLGAVPLPIRRGDNSWPASSSAIPVSTNARPSPR